MTLLFLCFSFEIFPKFDCIECKLYENATQNQLILIPNYKYTKMSTFTTWKVSTNSKLFNYKKAQNDHTAYVNRTRTEPVRIYQSMGRAAMVNYPKVHDIVYFSSAKKEVLVGRIIADVAEGVLHRQCPYNKGKTTEEIPDHRKPQKYTVIEITAVGNETELRGVQRTWSKYN